MDTDGLPTGPLDHKQLQIIHCPFSSSSGPGTATALWDVPSFHPLDPTGVDNQLTLLLQDEGQPQIIVYPSSLPPGLGTAAGSLAAPPPHPRDLGQHWITRCSSSSPPRPRTVEES